MYETIVYKRKPKLMYRLVCLHTTGCLQPSHSGTNEPKFIVELALRSLHVGNMKTFINFTYLIDPVCLMQSFLRLSHACLWIVVIAANPANSSL
jgi:hypothetical protein